MVQQAISDSLKRRGLTRVVAGGDVTVAYLLLSGNNVSTKAVSDYFGYGRDYFELMMKAHDKTLASTNPNYFEKGTLLIDIVDSGTFKVLSRNYATRPLRTDLPMSERAVRIAGAVEEIFAGVKFQN